MCTGGIKTVTRFNILFDGESETGLSELRKVARRHQKKLQLLTVHRNKISELPGFDALQMPSDMADTIIARVGGTGPFTSRRRKREGSSDGYAAAAEPADAPAAPASVARTFLQLHQADQRKKLGLPVSSPERAAPAADPAGSAMAAAHERAYTGWRLGLDDAWHKCVFPNAQARLKGALQEAAEEFAFTHNKLAYQAAFTRETGLQVGANRTYLMTPSLCLHVCMLHLQGELHTMTCRDSSRACCATWSRCVCVYVFQWALQSIQTGAHPCRAHPCRAHKSDQDKAGGQESIQAGRVKVVV